MWINFCCYLVTVSSFVVVWGYAPLKEPSSSQYNEPSNEFQFLHGGSLAANHFGLPLGVGVGGGPADLDSRHPLFSSGNSDVDDLEAIVPYRIPKQMEFNDGGGGGGGGGNVDYDFGFGQMSGQPSIRDQEYLQHSSLWGHKYMSGGGGELQHMIDEQVKPNPDNVKTDAVLPAYCNPPNPCPVGFTAEEGCLEIFENSASFSRAYQASQECMCDTEHMFDCSHNHEEPDDSDFDQSQQDFLNDLRGTDDDEHKTVAKKFYNKRNHLEKLNQVKQLAQLAAFDARQFDGVKAESNPFLHGEKLPIAAKKGNRAH